MKTLKHLRIVLAIAFFMAMFLWAADGLSDGIPPYYELTHVLIEIGFATGFFLVIYSAIYFFLRLVFYLSDRKKVTPIRNSQNSPASFVV